VEERDIKNIGSSMQEASTFRTRGVPGPTSKLLSRAPAQMGRRETEREGGKRSRRETGVKGETRGLRVCPAPKSGALAVGGYKRPRGRDAVVAAGEVLTPCSCVVVAVGGALVPGGRTTVGAVESLLTSPCFRKGAESRRRHGACGAPSLLVYRGEPDRTPVLFPAARAG
jgi:hypothetical protein